MFRVWSRGLIRAFGSEFRAKVERLGLGEQNSGTNHDSEAYIPDAETNNPDEKLIANA